MTKRLGFHVLDEAGFAIDTFHARGSTDVERALLIEWGERAKQFRVRRVPASTIGFDPKERYADLTRNSGWGELSDA